MIIRKEVEFNKDEIAAISKFVKIVRELSVKTGISESPIMYYFLDCSEGEINEGKHDLELIEDY